ncbi:MAG: hypothetical protein A3E78_13950 [Alphaproteobacteria bacterium RIFCSPHIGHO2_12_FULL_63_12]|nr:MAG: hypothetical protein A3E78_13950 [Alphaproteobacteria bacterium RIFCSPHIGHO2_12_FULL_63_12]
MVKQPHRRCSATSASGRACKLPARYGELCLQHASSAGNPEACAEQLDRLKGRPFDWGRYFNDSIAFAIDCLGVTPWSRQADFLGAAAANDRIALKAGQKVSKSNSLGVIMLWFAKTRPGARVFFTNSSERQVSSVNYRELRRLVRGAKVDLGIKVVHDTPGRGIVFEDGAEVVGFATDEADRLGGLSGENLMFVVDEASGIPATLFEAIEGNTAGDNAKLIVCGNPLRPADYFYDCFNAHASSWHCMTISSLESPNVTEGREVIRGLASPGYITRIEENYGIGSPFWSARVAGEFPEHSEYCVIALGDVLEAVKRHAATQTDLAQPLVCGLDVSRFGDDESVAAFVRGPVVLGLEIFRNLDGPTLAARVAGAAEKYRQPGERVAVRVDVIGVGASPYDAFSAYDWIDAVPITVSEKPTLDDHYARLRDQLWFECARWLKTGAIPNDQKLIGELTAPTYAFTIQGNRQVESKADLKKRLKRSPDRADALCLAVGGARRLTMWDRLAELDDDGPAWNFYSFGG